MKNKFAVTVTDLHKSYGKTVAIDGISFSIGKNEVFGLVGPNGAGKSTTLRILATILSADSGKVSISGNDLVDDADKIREILTYLPEEAGAYQNMSGKDYLLFMAKMYTTDKTLQQKYVKTGTELADLGKRLADKVKTYSKGMSRKLLLARALMTKPQFAILDEPTSGLDVINSRFIRETIRNYAKSGTTVLLSSHNMLEVELLSDRVALINEGKIVEIGTPEEIIKKNNCADLEEVFMKYIRKK